MKHLLNEESLILDSGQENGTLSMINQTETMMWEMKLSIISKYENLIL